MQRKKYSAEIDEPPVLMHATPMLYAFLPIVTQEDIPNFTLESIQHNYQSNTIEKIFSPTEEEEDTLDITLELIQYEYQGSSIEETFINYANNAISKMDEYKHEYLNNKKKEKNRIESR